MYGDFKSSNLLQITMFGASHQESCFLDTPGTNILLAASPSLVVDPTEFEDLMCNLQNATSIGHKILCNIYVQSMDIVAYFFYVTSPR